MALGLDFLRVVSFPGLRSNLGKIFTPTAFRLIAQGCVATLGEVVPNPDYAEGVTTILGGEDNMLQNYVGLWLRHFSPWL